MHARTTPKKQGQHGLAPVVSAPAPGPAKAGASTPAKPAAAPRRSWGSTLLDFCASPPHVVVVLLLAALATVPYLNTLYGKITYDDKVAVSGNPDVVKPDVTLHDIFTHDFWGNKLFKEEGGQSFGWTHHSWRPLVVLSFRFNQMQGNGNTYYFHVSNLIFHALATLAAYAAFVRIMGAAHRGRAALAAALFALHPIHTECVSNITSRADTVAAVFQFLSLFIYAGGTRVYYQAGAAGAAGLPKPGRCAEAARYVGCLVMVLLALMCKETTLVLPALCGVIDIAAAMGRGALTARAAAAASEPPAARARALAAAVWSELPVLRVGTHLTTAAIIYYLRIVVMAQGYNLASWANPVHNPMYYIADRVSRLLSIAMVQAFALSKLLFPYFLSHEHNAIRMVDDWNDPRNLLTVAVWTTLGALIWTGGKMLWRAATVAHATSGKEGKEQPEAAAAITPGTPAWYAGVATRIFFGLGFVAVSYLPSSHAALYVAFVLAERTLFLPSFGAVVIVAEVITAAAEWASYKKAAAAAAGTDAPAPKAAAPAPARLSLRGLATYAALLGPLTAFYSWRTYTRNFDWLDEEALMRANLALYPDNNWMTVYGLGAVALYAGKVEDAAQHLAAAANHSSMVEPHILLSQLEWKFKAASGGYDRAEAILKRLVNSTTPRREVFTNLGMLMLRWASEPADKKDAEYYILAAHVAHGYPSGHSNIGVLANNAACMRALSEPDRYGNPPLALEAAEEALTLARVGGTVAAYRNAALLNAIYGQYGRAMAVLQEGAAAAEKSWSEVAANPREISYPGSRQYMLDYFSELHVSLRRLALTIEIHRPALVQWMMEGPVSGAAAQERIAYLGTECFMEMLWW